MNAQTTQIHTEVVLEIDGRYLIGGRPEDFLVDPVRGHQFFYEGNLFEVTDSISTIGAPNSKVGSVLVELLNILYPDQSTVSSMLAGKRNVSEPVTAPSLIATDASGIVTSGLSLISVAQRERLLYLRLTMIPHKAPNIWQQLAAGDAASRVAHTGEPTKTAE